MFAIEIEEPKPVDAGTFDNEEYARFDQRLRAQIAAEKERKNGTQA